MYHNILSTISCHGVLTNILILNIIKDFISFNNYNNLISSTKQMRNNSPIFINLNRKFTKKYLLYKLFRDSINNRLFNPNIQLGLNIHTIGDNDILLCEDNNEENNEIDKYVKDKYYVECFLLTIKSSSNINMDCFINLSKLILDNCDGIETLPEFNKLKELSIINCNSIKSINAKSLNKLSLINNGNISDISSLTKIEYMVISNCNKLNNFASIKYKCKEVLFHNIKYKKLDISHSKLIMLVGCELNYSQLYNKTTLIILDKLNIKLINSLFNSFIISNIKYL